MHQSTEASNADKKRKRWSRRAKIVSAVVGALMAGAGAYAASNWAVNLNSGSSGEAQSASINNLTITAVSSPAAGNLLYPGGTGDVVLQIQNPNSFPVTITAVSIPSSSTYAAGYSDAALTTANTGCPATNTLAPTTVSYVAWNYATTASSSHTLTSPVTVAANGTLAVTLTNDAVMGTAAPAACASSYFQMPSLAGVTASADNATPTSGPVTDGWTS